MMPFMNYFKSVFPKIVSNYVLRYLHLLRHMTRKKKKVHKNKETDDTSLSSDSSNVFPSDVPTYASTNAVNGYVDHGSDNHVDHPTPANNVEISSEGNDIFKGVKPSKKSAESLLFDELFEKVVFGKIVPSIANKDPNPASAGSNEMNSQSPTAEILEFVETTESFNMPGDCKHHEFVCDDEQRIALSEEPEIERISETVLANETRQLCRAFDKVLLVENVCDEVSTTECLEVTTVLKEDEGNEDDTEAEIVVIENVQESNFAPTFDSPSTILEETSEFKCVLFAFKYELSQNEASISETNLISLILFNSFNL